MRLLVLAACTALALSACKRTEAPATAATPVAATAVASSCSGGGTSANPAHDNLNAVAWVQTSVEYKALSEQTYRAAADHLDQALKEKNWDALVPEERGNAATGLKPAVVMDVDETVLDNSPYQARLVRDGTDYDDVSWDAVGGGEESASRCRAWSISPRPPAPSGVTVLYISNRAVHLKDATIANLRAVGLPVADDSVFLGLGTFVEGLRAERQREELPAPAGRAEIPRADAVRRPDRRFRPGRSPIRREGRDQLVRRIPRLVRRALVDAAQPHLRLAGNRRCSTTTGPSRRKPGARPSARRWTTRHERARRLAVG